MLSLTSLLYRKGSKLQASTRLAICENCFIFSLRSPDGLGPKLSLSLSMSLIEVYKKLRAAIPEEVKA